MLVEPATRKPVSLRLGFVLCAIFFGVNVTEACSVNLLPVTLALFTENPQAIFLILAINPLFGVIAQPLVGVVSDRIWTPLGRRAFFLFTCSPIVAACLVLIPLAENLVQIIVIVVFLQFFQDILNGSDQPLLADLVPPEQRTFVLGLVKTFENLSFFFVLYIGMGLVESYKQSHGEIRYGMPLYYIAATCQIVFVMIAALFLREVRIQRPTSPRLTPGQYLRDFIAQPMLLRIAMAYFMRAFARTAVVGSVALYALKTLQISEEQFGSSWGWYPFVALLLGIPLGLTAERFSKNHVLQVAFTTLILGCIVGYNSTGPLGLAVAAVVFGTGDMLLEVTHKAFMSDRYPSHMIGQLTGAVNIFYALGRTTALVVVGFCVKLTNSGLDFNSPAGNDFVDYHVTWIISAISAILGIAILFTVRDFRYESSCD